MGILLSVYNDMVKEAEKSVVAEQVETLAKYASAASELLQAEFPNDYTKEDVVELADKLIQRDIAIESQNEKVAEAKAFTEEYVKVAEQLLTQEHGTDFTKEAVSMLADKMMELDAQEEFNKEAEAIKMQGFLDEFNKTAETSFESMEELEEAIKEAAAAGVGSGLAAIAKAQKAGRIGSVALNIGTKAPEATKATGLLGKLKNPLVVGAGAGAAGLGAGMLLGGSRN